MSFFKVSFFFGSMHASESISFNLSPRHVRVRIEAELSRLTTIIAKKFSGHRQKLRLHDDDEGRTIMCMATPLPQQC